MTALRDRRRRVAHAYDAAAARYDRRWAGYTRRTLALLRPLLSSVPADAALLDVGCGTGALVPRLRDWGVPLGRYVGLDAAPAMLGPAATRLAADAPWPWALAAGDAGALPFAAASFHVAVSASTLHDWPDPAAAFAEARRVLRPGGRLVLLDWSADFLSMRLLQRWLRLRGDPMRRVDTSACVRSALEAAGFRVAAVHTAMVAPLWGMMVVDAVA